MRSALAVIGEHNVLMFPYNQDREVAELSGELEDEWKDDGVRESDLSNRILAKARALLKEIVKAC